MESIKHNYIYPLPIGNTEETMTTSDKLIIAMIQAIDRDITIVKTTTRHSQWSKK